jgi:molybdopterin converting factor small subunit
MSVTVRIPTPLRKFTAGQGKLQAQAGALKDILATLAGQHEGLGGRLFEGDGTLRTDARIFVGEEDIRSLAGLDTQVADGATIAIIPPIAGA